MHARVCACAYVRARVCVQASLCASVFLYVWVYECVCARVFACLREGLLICLCVTERVHLTLSHRWLMSVKLLQRIFVYEGEKENRKKKKKNIFPCVLPAMN